MATSIGKLSKVFFYQITRWYNNSSICILGNGWCFRGGNQNVIASIDSKKISTQEFVDYVRRLNLTEDQIKDLSKTDLVEKILTEFMGKKVMSLEIEKLGISVNDKALVNIIKNDEVFLRTKNSQELSTKNFY